MYLLYCEPHKNVNTLSVEYEPLKSLPLEEEFAGNW